MLISLLARTAITALAAPVSIESFSLCPGPIYFVFLTEFQNKLKILREVNDFKESGTEA